MIVSSLAFATMGALTRAAGDQFDWRFIAFSRSLLALVFALSLCFSAGVTLIFFRPRAIWMRSLAGSFSLVCGFFALTRLPVADSATLCNMYPVWIAVLSWPMLRQTPSPAVWLALAIALVGVVLIHRPDLNVANLAVLAAVGASFSSAVAMIGLHKVKSVDPRATVVHFSAVATLTAAASLAITRPAIAQVGAWNWTSVAMLLGIGLSATCGQIFMTRAYAFGSPTKVSVVALSQVVFAVLYDLLVWGRHFDGITVAGILLVVSPTGWILGRGVQS